MRDLFRTFNSLLCPPPPPPTTSITADDFATFFTDKTRTIGNSSQLHNTGHPTNHIHCSNSHLLRLSPHRGGSIQTSPLQPSYNMSLLTQSPLTFSKQSLPHSYRHSHTLSTHLSALASSPQRSSRLG